MSDPTYLNFYTDRYAMAYSDPACDYTRLSGLIDFADAALDSAGCLAALTTHVANTPIMIAYAVWLSRSGIGLSGSGKYLRGI